jgi:hypothetical protein
MGTAKILATDVEVGVITEAARMGINRPHDQQATHPFTIATPRATWVTRTVWKRVFL